MKNFRKVLALILVVATLFSVAAMASAKTVADYEDGDKISYVEAVDVLSAIGILNGYEDETFKPTNNIRRDEMAKMIAVLSNAGDDVSDLYADACDFADCKGNWAKSYIAYCAETGVVAGRNATTFDPTAKVTGLETAKMLLVVLGFDAKEQGYLGAHWDTNVLRDAKEMGLLNGFASDYNVKRAITREEAANMFLNALNAPMVVGYLSKNVVKLSNDLFIKWADWDDGDLTITLPDAERDGWTIFHKTNAVISTTPLYSIYGTLEKTVGADCYGNPGVKWTLFNSKKHVIFEKTYTYAPTYTYTTAANLAKDLKQEIASNYDYALFVDGTEVSMSVADFAKKYTGNGVLTQVFISDATDEFIITVKNTFIGEVESISKKSVEFDLVTSTAIDDTYNYGKTDFSNKGLNFKKGDIVLYWVCSDEDHLHDAKIAEPTTVELKRAYYGSNPYIVADGKEYKYEHNFRKFVDFGNGIMTNTEVRNGGEYDLFLDEYGYIMAWKANVPGSETFYAYAVEGTGFIHKDGYDGKGNPTYTADKDLVDFDAKYTADVKVTKNTFDNTLNDKKATGTLFSYVMAGDKVDLTATANTASSNAILTKDGDLVDGNVTLPGRNSTKYLVRTWNYGKGEYEYTAFTGKLDKSYAGKVYVDGITDNEIATVQYFTDGEFLTYVFVDAIYSATSSRAFVLSEDNQFSDTDFVHQIDDVRAYTAIINGKRSVLLLNKRAIEDTTNFLYESNFECIGLTVDEVPVYTASKAVTPVNELQAFEYVDGRLVVRHPGADEYYRVAEEAFAVVAFEGGYNDMDAIVLDGVEEINDYLEDNFDGDYDADKFDTVMGWLVGGEDGYADEIYLIVK